MYVDWMTDGCDQEDEREIERLWEQYQPELHSKMGQLTIEPSELQLVVIKNSETDLWELQAALHLLQKTLAAEATGGSLQDAFEKVVSSLVSQIDEEQDVVGYRARRQQGLQAIVPLLRRAHRSGRSETFLRLLGPLAARSLLPHIEQELHVLELEGIVSSESVTPDEVLDDALLMAWEQFDARPPNVPLDLWLLGLIHRAVNTYIGRPPHLSLEDEREVVLPEVDQQSSPFSWLEQPTYPETVELKDLLPGHPGVDTWDSLDREQRQEQLTELLSYLTREQRQTLVLYAVEGFEPALIAAIQGRSPEDVRSDIRTGRKRLEDRIGGVRQ